MFLHFPKDQIITNKNTIIHIPKYNEVALGKRVLYEDKGHTSKVRYCNFNYIESTKITLFTLFLTSFL